MQDKKLLEKIAQSLSKDFSEHKLKDEDIIRIAKDFGCPTLDINVCKIFLKEYYYRENPKNNEEH